MCGFLFGYDELFVFVEDFGDFASNELVVLHKKYRHNTQIIPVYLVNIINMVGLAGLEPATLRM